MPDPTPTPRTASDLFGPGRPPRDTREKLLFRALDLFYVHGFHEVGLDRILEETGVTKTTFYNHFESRDHLIREAVVLRNEWEASVFAREVQRRAGFDPRKMLLAVFDVLDDFFTLPDYRGCLFLAASTEFPSRTHPVHKAAAQHYVDAERDLLRMAEAAGARDPVGLARTWQILVQGALMARQTLHDDAAARRARAAAERLLAAELGPG